MQAGNMKVIRTVRSRVETNSGASQQVDARRRHYMEQYGKVVVPPLSRHYSSPVGNKLIPPIPTSWLASGFDKRAGVILPIVPKSIRAFRRGEASNVDVNLIDAGPRRTRERHSISLPARGPGTEVIPIAGFTDSDTVIGDKCLTRSPSPLSHPDYQEQSPCTVESHIGTAPRSLPEHPRGFFPPVGKNFSEPQLKYRRDLPYFTLSVSAIQVVVFLVHWGIYGFSPVGVSVISHHMATITLPNGTSGRVCWVEPENTFIGPRQVDLIRAGARYPPCMRFDSQLHSTVIQRQHSFDRLSGCCLNRAARSCHQTSHAACSAPTYDWLTSSDFEPGLSHSPSEASDSSVASVMDPVRKSNTSVVCGLDPNYCLKPRSSPSLPWPDDISEWPTHSDQLFVVGIHAEKPLSWRVCENVANTSSEIDPSPPHMQCQVIGRPCCFGILGECVVTTEEHCKFMHGSYHSKAAVCSQVNCLKDVCGMAPFLKGAYADQWYRLITSLFIHSGLVPLIITITIQVMFMWDLELFHRSRVVGAVYLISGCFGNVVAAYFLPYQIGTGPTASLMGLMGLRATSCFFYSIWTPSPKQSRRHTRPSYNIIGDLDDCEGQRLTRPQQHSERSSLSTIRRASVFPPMRHRTLQRLRKNVLYPIGVFVLGLFPWLDNFAHLGGFVAGCLLTFIFLPYSRLRLPSRCRLKPKPNKRRLRIPIEVVCFCTFLALSVMMFCLFWLSPVLNCPRCNYFTCIPLVPHLCDQYFVNISQRALCVPESL